MAPLIHIPYHWWSPNHEARLAKEAADARQSGEDGTAGRRTKGSVPFEVELTPEVVKQLQAEKYC